MKIIDCTHDEHAGAILEIINDAIAHSTALYEYRPRSLESMRGWFEVKARGQYPVLGALDDAGALVGFASYGAFRPHAAYKYSIEHSVYVERARRAQGIGEALLTRLIERAGEQQYHVMVGGIDQENQASIGLHLKLGFEHAGTIRQAGFKFGRWLDLAFYRRQLAGPEQPMDG